MWRRTPLKPSAGTQWPRDVRQAIVERDDGRCVASRAGLPGDCLGNIELDHVRASGAISKKSRSTVDNGVVLCATHHAWKTEHGREARPLLLDYIERATRSDDCGHPDPSPYCAVCVERMRRLSA